MSIVPGIIDRVDPVLAAAQKSLTTDVGKYEIEHSSAEVAPIDGVVIPPVHCAHLKNGFGMLAKPAGLLS